MPAKRKNKRGGMFSWLIGFLFILLMIICIGIPWLDARGTQAAKQESYSQSNAPPELSAILHYRAYCLYAQYWITGQDKKADFIVTAMRSYQDGQCGYALIKLGAVVEKELKEALGEKHSNGSYKKMSNLIREAHWKRMITIQQTKHLKNLWRDRNNDAHITDDEQAEGQHMVHGIRVLSRLARA